MPTDCTAAADTSPFYVVGIAASAGGLDAISRLMAALPPTIPGAIVVLQHLSPHFKTRLASILQSRTQLRVVDAEDGALLSPGTAYVAPPGRHTTLTPAPAIRLNDDPPVGFLRPSANVLLASMGEHLLRYAVAVILTGTGSDGAVGLVALKACGGTVIVQDPREAAHDSMPRSAIATGTADFVLPLDDIAAKLVQLTGSRGPYDRS